MAHSASRPIIVDFTDADSPIYIPIAREREAISIQVGDVIAGITNIDVDITGDNIIRSRASSYDVNSKVVAQADSEWSEVDALLTGFSPVSGVYYSGFEQGVALRVTVNVGTGTARIIINQAE